MANATTQKQDSPTDNNNQAEVEVSVAPTDMDDIPNNRSLTGLERRNLICLVLAFASTVASLTLVVGSGAIVIKSIPNASIELAPFAVGALFLGMSFVSLCCTHWMFDRWGRIIGFWFGMTIGIVGSIVGGIGLVIYESTILVIFSNVLLGAGCGIGMYLRFAAVEVVPAHFQSKAVTWVLGGGCIAAFVGPETAHATTSTNLFGYNSSPGKDHVRFLGIFVVAGCFFLLQGLFVGLTKFETIPKHDMSKTQSITSNARRDESSDTDLKSKTKSMELFELNKHDSNSQNYQLAATPATDMEADIKSTHENFPKTIVSLKSILCNKNFLIPVMVATLNWIIMAMPMSIFRVAMNGSGYTERQSLTVIEFHFIGMYGPGLCITGSFISKFGYRMGCVVGMVLFVIATGCSSLAQQQAGETALPNIILWYIALFLLGCGWNFGFSSATVWVTQSYMEAPTLKSKVQAANEFGMFILSGMAVFSTGYLYDVGNHRGSQTEDNPLIGWRFLNYTVITGMICVLSIVLFVSREPGDGQNVADSENDINSLREEDRAK